MTVSDGIPIASLRLNNFIKKTTNDEIKGSEGNSFYCLNHFKNVYDDDDDDDDDDTTIRYYTIRDAILMCARKPT